MVFGRRPFCQVMSRRKLQLCLPWQTLLHNAILRFPREHGSPGSLRRSQRRRWRSCRARHVDQQPRPNRPSAAPPRSSRRRRPDLARSQPASLKTGQARSAARIEPSFSLPESQSRPVLWQRRQRRTNFFQKIFVADPPRLTVGEEGSRHNLRFGQPFSAPQHGHPVDRREHPLL